jgi:hypothetical protein
MLVLSVKSHLNPKIEVRSSSEMLISTYKNTRCHNPEDYNLSISALSHVPLFGDSEYNERIMVVGKLNRTV